MGEPEKIIVQKREEKTKERKIRQMVLLGFDAIRNQRRET